MLADDIFSNVRPRAIGASRELRPGALDRLLARARRPLDRAYERRATAIAGMARLSAQVATATAASPARATVPTRAAAANRAPRVLVAALRGWSAHNAYELTIAQALRLRGARVALLTCGGGMPACELGWARAARPRPCDRCGWLTDRVLEAAAIERYRLAELLPWGDDAGAAPLDHRPEAAGDARVSTGWLLKATQLDRLAEAPEIARDFAISAEGVEHALATVFERFDPDVVLLLNGLFAAERAIRRVAARRGVRSVTYEIAPRGGALVFARDPAAAPSFELDRVWAKVRDRELTERQRAELLALLRDRERGVGAHESYYERVEERPDELRRRLELAEHAPVVSLFTNVTWDSATLGHDIGFASMFDWIEQTVRAIAGREQTLVIRVHPGEERWGTREQAREVVESRLGEVPDNVRFVGAGDPLSSYTLIELSQLLLTYTTTLGLEAATRGKSVAVCGDTHYRQRGFTVDVSDSRQLLQALARIPQALPAHARELALRYAHMFFFRAMIPFPSVGARSGRVVRLPGSARELVSGADPYLDWVCERILDGGDFDLPDELAHALPAEPGDTAAGPLGTAARTGGGGAPVGGTQSLERTCAS